ncbi:hypothetical protein M9H77_11616 [Catharanthus roseus]|uniref:Uncharacterized protein n=1 Tax=Catharanthus roseus TaxID=4058 RepID=A0ACC0BF50_CATRO|nr:hypothetical protein M9H77_11616 [Catharanthus roseus]
MEGKRRKGSGWFGVLWSAFPFLHYSVDELRKGKTKWIQLSRQDPLLPKGSSIIMDDFSLKKLVRTYNSLRKKGILMMGSFIPAPFFIHFLPPLTKLPTLISSDMNMAFAKLPWQDDWRRFHMEILILHINKF